MIEDIRDENDELVWCSNGKECHGVVNGGNYIYDESNILIMNSSRDKVITLDEYGNQAGSVNSTDSVYLMYLQKHPRFGLSVVASLKDQNGNWSDKYLSWRECDFKVVSNSR